MGTCDAKPRGPKPKSGIAHASLARALSYGCRLDRSRSPAVPVRGSRGDFDGSWGVVLGPQADPRWTDCCSSHVQSPAPAFLAATSSVYGLGLGLCSGDPLGFRGGSWIGCLRLD